jgi:16S rRNA (guanine966-N2)-methyltransferase
MTGRARESLFSILGDQVVGAAVLDLFAGSGSLGLEALSRGADRAVFVERGPAALRALARNVERVGLGGRVISADVSGALAGLDDAYDLVFVDPPYAMDDRGVTELLARIEGVLAPKATVVLHRRDHGPRELPEFLTWRDERRYGDAVVTLMERSSP